jgi:excisionase family DNA binding protein
MKAENEKVVPKTLSIDEAAKMIGIGRNLAYEAARCGQLPAIRIGRRYRIPITALQRFLDEAGRAGKKAA